MRMFECVWVIEWVVWYDVIWDITYWFDWRILLELLLTLVKCVSVISYLWPVRWSRCFLIELYSISTGLYDAYCQFILILCTVDIHSTPPPALDPRLSATTIDVQCRRCRCHNLAGPASARFVSYISDVIMLCVACEETHYVAAPYITVWCIHELPPFLLGAVFAWETHRKSSHIIYSFVVALFFSFVWCRAMRS